MHTIQKNIEIKVNPTPDGVGVLNQIDTHYYYHVDGAAGDYGLHHYKLLAITWICKSHKSCQNWVV